MTHSALRQLIGWLIVTSCTASCNEASIPQDPDAKENCDMPSVVRQPYTLTFEDLEVDVGSYTSAPSGIYEPGFAGSWFIPQLTVATAANRNVMSAIITASYAGDFTDEFQVAWIGYNSTLTGAPTLPVLTGLPFNAQGARYLRAYFVIQAYNDENDVVFYSGASLKLIPLQDGYVPHGTFLVPLLGGGINNKNPVDIAFQSPVWLPWNPKSMEMQSRLGLLTSSGGSPSVSITLYDYTEVPVPPDESYEVVSHVMDSVPLTRRTTIFPYFRNHFTVRLLGTTSFSSATYESYLRVQSPFGSEPTPAANGGI